MLDALRFALGGWRRGRPDDRRIAVAVPTYNRAAFLLECVPPLVGDPRIAEIVIADDASEPDDYRGLAERLAPRSPRIRLHRNAANLGAFHNKVVAVGLCRSEWVVLLDSDNQLPARYIDRLFALPAWAPSVLYCPERARPHFDYARLRGAVIDLGAARRLLERESPDLMNTFLGTGNFFVHGPSYVRVMGPHVACAVAGADANYATYLWLRAGRLLYAVPGLEYEHRRHPASLFQTTAELSKDLVRGIRSAILTGGEFQPPVRPPAERA